MGAESHWEQNYINVFKGISPKPQRFKYYKLFRIKLTQPEMSAKKNTRQTLEQHHKYITLKDGALRHNSVFPAVC